MEFTFILLIILSLALGIWMTVDGRHVMQTGRYMGTKEPGPWAIIVRQVGLDPFKIGPVFTALGAVWLFISISLILGITSELLFILIIIIAILTLWYIPIGTILAVVVIILAVMNRDLIAPVYNF